MSERHVKRQSTSTSSDGNSALTTRTDTHNSSVSPADTSGTDTLTSLYLRKANVCRELMTRLDLSIKRHEGLIQHLRNIEENVEKQKNLAFADLRNRYELALCELKANYEHCALTIDAAAKEKSRVLKEKSKQIELILNQLTDTRTATDLRLRVESKPAFVEHFRLHVADLQDALQLQYDGKLLLTEFEVPKMRPVAALKVAKEEIQRSKTARNSVERSQEDVQMMEMRREFEGKRRAILRRSVPGLLTPDTSFTTQTRPPPFGLHTVR